MTSSSLKKSLPIILAVLIFELVLISFTVLSNLNAANVYVGKAGCAGLKLNDNCFDLEVADSNEARVKGLSDRNGLVENSGMLFVFDTTSEQCLWMKDMRFDLDIIFVSESKNIIKIEKNVSPQTYPNSFCAGDVKFAMEFDSGFADEHGLIAGEELKF